MTTIQEMIRSELLVLIAGHGAGDPGAISKLGSRSWQEAQESRTLVPLIAAYSEASVPNDAEVIALDRYGDSEFLKAVSGKNPVKVWAIIDDLMDALKVVNRRANETKRCQKNR